MESMHYTRDTFETSGEYFMEPMPDLTVGQIMGLPPKTELLVIDIAPFGMGIRVHTHVIDEKFKEGLLDAAEHADCDHGMSRDEIEASRFPGSVFIVLPPADYEPSIEEIVSARFIKKGEADGRDGMPMLSESLLKTRTPADEWHDDAYRTYVSAYKRGTERRKGR